MPSRTGSQPAELPAAQSWGLLPALSIVAAIGLVLMALADSGGRQSTAWAYPLFWVSMAWMFVPIAWRLVSAQANRRERIGLVVLLGLALYMVKILQTPLAFMLMDESAHWLNVQQIVETGHLFHHNGLLPVSPYYPGLENVTAALVSLSGLSIVTAARAVVAVARVIITLALFLLYERLSGSPRVAGIATLVYMGNPGFVFFDTQFAYESMALPLASLALFCLLRRTTAPRIGRIGLTVAALVLVAAVVTTHHVTSYILAAFLILWAACVGLQRVRVVGGPGPGGPALLATVAGLSWLLYVASLTIGYLSPQLQGALNEFVRLISGELTGRQLFRTYTGQVAPLWERITTYSAVLLILIGLPFGVSQVWRRHRQKALALALAVAALAYPVSLGVRLTERGAEAASRSSEFLFVAIAFVLGLAVVELALARPSGWRPPLVVAGAAIIFAGGIIAGSPGWARVPGPYLVAADQRSIDAEGIAAATWTKAVLGPGNRIVGDRTNDNLMATYGEQRPVTGYGDQQYAYLSVFAPDLGPREWSRLRVANVRYLVIDRRLSTALPLIGVYFEIGEPETFHRSVPLDSALLTKFDAAPQIGRIFDSGDIVIYDAAPLTGPSESASAARPVRPVADLAAGPPLGGAGLAAVEALAATGLLLLTGYVLTIALLPGSTVGAWERMVLSLGLTVALLALGGILLNWLPLGLQAFSWAALVGGTIVAVAVGTWLARRYQPAEPSGRRRGPELRAGHGVLLALAALTVMGAMGIAVLGTINQPSKGFTQLWMLPGSGPTASVQLGIRNQENGPVRYRLELQVGTRTVRTWPSIELKPGMQWQGAAVLPDASSGPSTVTASLFRLDGPQTRNRWVRLFVPGRQVRAQAGVRNQENGPVRYRLELPTGAGTVRTWPSVELAPGLQSQATGLLPAAPSTASLITASLFRLDSSLQPYRWVRLSVPSQQVRAP